MAHDEEYAQRRMIEEKHATLEASALAETLARLSGRLDELQRSMADIRLDVRNIKESLRA